MGRRAPIELAHRFHRFFFDAADLAIRDRGVLALRDVVIGRPSPLLREIQLLASTLDPYRLLRLSAFDVARQFGLSQDERICTTATLFDGALDESPCIGDAYLERLMVARLLLSATATLACVAPYVQIGGVAVVYRLARLRAPQVSASSSSAWPASGSSNWVW